MWLVRLQTNNIDLVITNLHFRHQSHRLYDLIQWVQRKNQKGIKDAKTHIAVA
jgi:hypothetical protein